MAHGRRGRVGRARRSWRSGHRQAAWGRRGGQARVRGARKERLRFGGAAAAVSRPRRRAPRAEVEAVREGCRARKERPHGEVRPPWQASRGGEGVPVVASWLGRNAPHVEGEAAWGGHGGHDEPAAAERAARGKRDRAGRVRQQGEPAATMRARRPRRSEPCAEGDARGEGAPAVESQTRRSVPRVEGEAARGGRAGRGEVRDAQKERPRGKGAAAVESRERRSAPRVEGEAAPAVASRPRRGGLAGRGEARPARKERPRSEGASDVACRPGGVRRARKERSRREGAPAVASRTRRSAWRAGRAHQPWRASRGGARRVRKERPVRGGRVCGGEPAATERGARKERPSREGAPAVASRPLRSAPRAEGEAARGGLSAHGARRAWT
ncbi:hypothetical protein U9M48_037832 [Paspalum notatum var. saurae]|uniref:Uncharacterized protein n=1 Tax=Paspalum notatum var. saurae TaxID=547442 RepID=A0AAQ3UKQ5_PASNO